MVDRQFLAARPVTETRRRLAPPVLARIPDTRVAAAAPRPRFGHVRALGIRGSGFRACALCRGVPGSVSAIPARRQLAIKHLPGWVERDRVPDLSRGGVQDRLYAF